MSESAVKRLKRSEKNSKLDLTIVEIRPKNLCLDCGRAVTRTDQEGHIFFEKCQKHGDIQFKPSHCLHFCGSSEKFPVDFVILTATDVETTAVLKFLLPEGVKGWTRHVTRTAGEWQTSIYRISGCDDVSVRIALKQSAEMGLAAASALAATAIQVFRPPFVAMLGITAGVKDRTNIGDIITPSHSWDYGAGKWTGSEDIPKFQPRASQHRLDNELREKCKYIKAQKTLLQEIHREWSINHPLSSFSTPDVHVAPAVSGAAVIDTDAIWQRIFHSHDKVVALDMEAYGVFSAVFGSHFGSYKPRCLIAKSVCDFGIEKKKEFQEYAAYTSVSFFRIFLNTIFNETELLPTLYSNVPAGS